METSRDDRPEWLERPECPDERVCALGSRTRAAAIEYARTDAQHDAIKDFARRLESKTKARFKAGRDEGRLPELGESPEVDQAINELYVAASKLTVEDVKVEDFWWKKVRSIGEDQRYHYYFDYNVLVSLSEATWRRKVKAILDRQRKSANEASHAALVKELDEFSKDILEEEE